MCQDIMVLSGTAELVKHHLQKGILFCDIGHNSLKKGKFFLALRKKKLILLPLGIIYIYMTKLLVFYENNF